MIKHVWYSKKTGKFSNSWGSEDFKGDKQMLIDVANKNDDYVLISYEVETQFDFEFCNLMRLA